MTPFPVREGCRDGVMERPRKGQPEGMRRHGERKERPRGGVSGLRGRRRVRHAPGPAVHASPPGSRDTVGLCCRGRLRGARVRNKRSGEESQREVDIRTEGTWRPVGRPIGSWEPDQRGPGKRGKGSQPEGPGRRKVAKQGRAKEEPKPPRRGRILPQQTVHLARVRAWLACRRRRLLLLVHEFVLVKLVNVHPTEARGQRVPGHGGGLAPAQPAQLLARPQIHSARNRLGGGTRAPRTPSTSSSRSRRRRPPTSGSYRNRKYRWERGGASWGRDWKRSASSVVLSSTVPR